MSSGTYTPWVVPISMDSGKPIAVKPASLKDHSPTNTFKKWLNWTMGMGILILLVKKFYFYIHKLIIKCNYHTEGNRIIRWLHMYSSKSKLSRV